jgi:putative inorganic carbon (hco3(-)) transporter
MLVRGRLAARRLAAVEIWPVAFCTAASVVSARLLPLALGVAGLFWLVRWIAYGRLSVRTAGDWATGLLALMLPVTLWATALPHVTRLAVAALLTGIALYYAVANWAGTRERVRLVALGIMLAGLILVISAPFSVQWFADAKAQFIPEAWYRRMPLVVANPVHPNVMAGALVIVLPCALGPIFFGWHEMKRLEQWTAGLVTALLPLVVLLTKSRGALIGIIAGILVLIALRWRRGWLAPLGAGIVCVLAVWRIGPARVANLIAATGSVQGLEGRLEIWSRALKMILDTPFTGIGMGTFPQFANAVHPFLVMGIGAEIGHAHNLFMQLAVDVGLPGLVAWASIWMLAIVATWRTFRYGARTGDRWLTGLSAGLLCSQVTLAIHGVFDAVTWGTRPAILVWAIWGIAMATANLCGVSRPLAGRKESRSTSPAG